MAKAKKKRDLLSTFQSIERYHQRRAVFILHVVLSVALQMAMWGNWYASYARYGQGFYQNFFADRVIVSGILTLVIIGHYALMRMTGARDRMVILALQQHEDEVQGYAIDEDDLEDDPEADFDVPAVDRQRRQRR